MLSFVIFRRPAPYTFIKPLTRSLVAVAVAWQLVPLMAPASVHAAGCSPVASPSANVAPSGPLDTAANVIATFDNARQQEGCSTTLSINPSAYNSASPQQQMLMLFNAERTDRGLGTLTLDPTLLSQIDFNHSHEMAQYNFFAHQSPINQPANVFGRLTDNPAISGHWSNLGENIAAGFTTTGAAVYSYMYQDSGSAWGHRHNILGAQQATSTSPWTFGAFNWVGVGIYNNSNTGNGSYSVYYTSDFMQSSNYAPPSTADTQAPTLSAPAITSGAAGGTVTAQVSNVNDGGSCCGEAGVTGVVFYANQITLSNNVFNTVTATQSSPGVWTASLSVPAGGIVHAVAVDGSGNYTDCSSSCSGGSTGSSVAPGAYTPLTPARICDTRAGTGTQCSGQTLGQGAALTMQVEGQGGVPSSNISAVVLNVTVTNPTASSSYVTLYPTGSARPLSSNLNFVYGETVPNLVEVALSSNGQVTIYNAMGQVDVVVDVQGYVTSGTTGPAGLYNPLTPARILDTRPGSGQTGAGQTLQNNSTLTIQVTGQGGVPSSGVSAVVLNVTVTDPTAPSSYLTVYPAGVPRPLASNLNFIGGQTVPNRVMVPVSSSGQITLYNNVGNVDVVIDVGGYFTDASNPSASGSLFTGMTPFRIADTRAGSGEPYAGQTLGPGATLSVQVAGAGGVPSMGSAHPPRGVVLNVTVTDASGTSYLTVYPSDAARPLASDLNVNTGQTVPNLVVVKLSASGQVNIYNNTGSADVVVDVAGWYA